MASHMTGLLNKAGICVAILLSGALHSTADALDWRGSVGMESRLFLLNPIDDRQAGDNLSLTLAPEVSKLWDNGRQSFVFSPFLRLDQHDDERSHGDIRELTWLYAADRWELRLGIRKLFWGVTESQHLVDIINQTDLVEDPEGEVKLGQPMVNLALIEDWGTIDFFLLPYFRERTFPGDEGRLRTQPPVATDDVVYSSSADKHHLDYALRWNQSMAIWDIGISHFHGTRRAPLLSLVQTGNGAVLQPLYNIIDQTGVDLQATIDAWLWKAEVIHRVEPGEHYNAATVGFEYTFFAINDSAQDLGVLFEYLYDDRSGAVAIPFENDIMIGTRWVLNDVAGSEALLGVIIDYHGDGKIVNLEASRRFGNHWKLDVKARGYYDLTLQNPLYSFRRDNYVQLDLAYYF